MQMLFDNYRYRFENLCMLVWEWCSDGSIVSIELLDGSTFDPVCLVPIATIDVRTLLYICYEYDYIRNQYTNISELNVDESLVVGAIHELCDRGVCYCMRIKINRQPTITIDEEFDSSTLTSPEVSEED